MPTNGLPVEYDPYTGNQILSDVSTAPNIMQKLFGAPGVERFQTWPERMARSGLALPADVYEGRTPIESPTGYPGSVPPSSVEMEPRSIPKALGMGNFTVPGATSEIARAQDTSGMAGMGGIGMGNAANATLGVVPVGVAKKLKITASQPNDLLKSIVDNTPAATIDVDGALRINVKRGQHSDQEMAESVRGGVFYLPAGDKNFRHYKGKVDDNTGRAVNNYGGQQIVEGETAYLNPLIVKGATGGKAPEAAYTQLKGKDAFKKLNDDIGQIAYLPASMKANHQTELVQKFLEKYAPELMNHADYILENSKKGNQLRYALQEAAIASATRNAGHDGIIGYSLGRGQNSGKPFISEIFDVRENRYPSPSGDYSVHPQFLEDTRAATGISAVNQSGRKLTPIEGNPFAELEPKLTPVQHNPFASNLIPVSHVPEF